MAIYLHISHHLTDQETMKMLPQLRDNVTTSNLFLKLDYDLHISIIL
jgi:hypothetical protein